MSEELNTVQVINKILSEGSHEIIFTKKDGTRRVLNGTRDMGSIPDEFKPKTDRPINEKAIPVFDTEINQWRSFSVNNLISIDGVDYNTKVEDDK